MLSCTGFDFKPIQGLAVPSSKEELSHIASIPYGARPCTECLCVTCINNGSPHTQVVHHNHFLPRAKHKSQQKQAPRQTPNTFDVVSVATVKADEHRLACCAARRRCLNGRRLTLDRDASSRRCSRGRHDKHGGGVDDVHQTSHAEPSICSKRIGCRSLPRLQSYV